MPHCHIQCQIKFLWDLYFNRWSDLSATVFQLFCSPWKHKSCLSKWKKNLCGWCGFNTKKNHSTLRCLFWSWLLTESWRWTPCVSVLQIAVVTPLRRFTSSSLPSFCSSYCLCAKDEHKLFFIQFCHACFLNVWGLQNRPAVSNYSSSFLWLR